MEPERTMKRKSLGHGDFTILKRGMRSHNEAPWMTEEASFVFIVGGGALTFLPGWEMHGSILMIAGFVFFLHSQNLLPLPFGL